VGTLGDPGRLDFEGATTFTAKEIRQALMRTPEFLLASHPAAGLSEYMPGLKRLLESGYRQCGFPEAQVTVNVAQNRQRVSVKVFEGPRYTCGDIEVTGAQTLPTESFVQQMMEPRIKQTDGGKSETEDPIWQKGKWAPFSQPSQTKLSHEIQTLLNELGYYFCRFSVKVAPEAGTTSARLLVQIEEEGSRRIKEIIVSGNEKNTPEEILRYLELKEGMLLDRALIRKTEDLLWRSARFLKHDVKPEVDTAQGSIKLRIDLREYEPAPRLSEDFSPEEKMLLKCGVWLADFLEREDDLSLDLYIEEINIQLQVVISPTQGTLLVVRDGDHAQAAHILNAALLKPKKITFFSPTRKTKFVWPDLSAQITTRLSVTPNPDPSDGMQFVFNPGFGIKNKHSGDPYNIDIKLAPVAFVSCAHRDSIDLSDLLDQGMIRPGSGNDFQVKIDTQSGRLIELTAHRTGMGKLAFTLDRGIFARRVENIEQATSDHADGFDPQRPVGSSLRYLAAAPLLHRDLFRKHGAALDVSAQELARAVTVLGQVFANAAFPIDQWAIKRRGVLDDGFVIPLSPRQSATSLKRMLVSTVAALVFSANNELFPPGSWPWTLARETVFVAGGMGKYTEAELRRTYQSPQTGPIGYLAAAKLLTYANKPLSRMFAAKGLEHLSAEDFHKDWRLAVAEDHLLSQCLGRMIQVLQNLDEQDLNEVLALFSQGHAALVRDGIRGMRENKTKPLHEALAPVFRFHWEDALRAEVEQALRKLTEKSD